MFINNFPSIIVLIIDIETREYILDVVATHVIIELGDVQSHGFNQMHPRCVNSVYH